MNYPELESLSFPMFKTTIVEKYYLRKALNLPRPYSFLCVRLSQVNASIGLFEKISVAICHENTLVDYLKLPSSFIPNDFKQANLKLVELRTIWIRKLLTYTGE